MNKELEEKMKEVLDKAKPKLEEALDNSMKYERKYNKETDTWCDMTLGKEKIAPYNEHTKELIDAMSEPKKDWESKFDKQFEGYWRGQAIPDEIKFFIKQLRSDTLSSVEEKIEKEHGDHIGDAGTVVDEIIALIKEMI